MPKNNIGVYGSGQTWVGRSLENYISNHPKAKGAKSLTEARRLAFGVKAKSTTCKCGQIKCMRDAQGSPQC